MNEPTVYQKLDNLKVGDICHRCRKEFKPYEGVEFIELNDGTFYAKHANNWCDHNNHRVVGIRFKKLKI